MITYSTVIHDAEEGGYWAEVPSMPGCFSQGETLDEVKANIQEAAEGWILSQLEFRFSHPTVPHHGNQPLKQGLLLGIFRSANIPPPQR